MITGHRFAPIESAPSHCGYEQPGGPCEGLKANHLLGEDGVVQPHPPHLRNLVVQGGSAISNTACLLEGCEALRLAKVHNGFKPVYDIPDPTTEPMPALPPPPIMLFARGREVHATDTIPAVQAWDAYSAQVRALIIDKSGTYGDAWKEQGWRGNMARVLSKASRLKYMLWKSDTTDSTVEPVADTLLDMGSLVAFLWQNREEGNEWGR